MENNTTGNSSPEMIILTIVVLLILLYSIVSYHKSNYNNIGIILGISLFFIFLFDYFSQKSILNGFKENFTNLSNAPQLYSTYFAFIAFILVLIGLSISKNKLLSDTNSNYSLVITIIACITSFFIFSIYVQHYIGKSRYPDTYSTYFLNF